MYKKMRFITKNTKGEMKQKEKEYLIAETKARNELTETYVDESSSWEEEFEHYRWRGGCD